MKRLAIQFIKNIPKNLSRKIQKRNWYRHGIYRDTLVFATEIIRGLDKEFFRKENIKKGVDNYIQLGPEAYVTQKEFDEFVKILTDKLENEPNYLTKYTENYKKDMENAVKESRKLGRLNFKKLTNKDLADKFLHYFNVIAELHHWLWSMEFLNKAFDLFLRKNIRMWHLGWDDMKIEEFMLDISYIPKKIAFQKEQKEILGLSSLNDKKLLKIYNKYKWLNMHLVDGLPYTLNEYRKKASKYLGLKKENRDSLFKKELLIKKAKNLIKSVENLNLKKILKIAQELIYLKTHRIDVYTYTAFLTIPLRKEVARRIKLNLTDLNRYTVTEVFNFLNGGSIPLEELKERRVYGVIKVDGEQYYIKNKVVKKIKNIISEGEKNIKKLIGTIAYKGFIKGRVRTILNDREIKKVKKGEILVCNLTNPDYNPVFEKIKGLITDEGGILCHSAIMAREFKIPCIIGTKIATQVLKDGDLVEVDADKGVVKILKQ